MIKSAVSYSNGKTLYYRGNPLSLRLYESGEGSRVEERSGELIVRASPDECGKFLLFWYTAKTEEIVRHLLPEWSRKLGVRPRSVAVKYAKTRWGSCSSAGRVFFNSRLAMLPPDVCEYIVVHELCHMKQMNHSPAFWTEVRAALPDAMERRKSLREHEKNATL
ncbi:MAG: M48 family metallopeptidase [Synergistaceae bacterium]|nr:M48 family metallopeptidase [Synergistaceae bacterium]